MGQLREIYEYDIKQNPLSLLLHDFGRSLIFIMRTLSCAVVAWWQTESSSSPGPSSLYIKTTINNASLSKEVFSFL